MTSSLGRARSTKGAEDLLAVSKRLKEAGQTGVRKELNRGLQQAAKPLIPKVRAAAEKLPSRGGMNTHYARKRYRAQVRTGQRTAGVRIVAPKTDPRVDGEGRVAHPVFGRPQSTVVQQVPEAKGFFSETLAGEGQAIQADLRAVLNDFTTRIAKGG